MNSHFSIFGTWTNGSTLIPTISTKFKSNILVIKNTFLLDSRMYTTRKSCSIVGELALQWRVVRHQCKKEISQMRAWNNERFVIQVVLFFCQNAVNIPNCLCFYFVCQKVVQGTQLITHEIHMQGSSTTWTIDVVWLTDIENSLYF